MRILLLNQTFYPDVAATAQHAYDLASYFKSQGHEVVVVSSRSLYGQRGGKLARREIVDGIQVHRVGVSLFGKSHLVLRMIDFTMFYILAAVRALTLRRVDVAICLTTPPMIAVVGILMKWLRGSRFIYWIMDLYPDVLVACDVLPKKSLLIRLLGKINRWCIRSSDRTVVLGRCMQERVIGQGVPEEKIACIRIWSDTEELIPLPRDQNPYREQWSLGDRFVVMYSGNFGLGHDVETMCEAAKRLGDRDDIRFVFVGGGKRKRTVEKYVAKHHLANASCYEYQPREKLGALLSMADLHLASLIEPLAGVIVPSKAFGVMAAGRPVAFIGPKHCEVGYILEEHKCGQIVEIGDVDGLVSMIERLAENPELARGMGARARDAMAAHYDCQHACEAWEALVHHVVDEPVMADAVV